MKTLASYINESLSSKELKLIEPKLNIKKVNPLFEVTSDLDLFDFTVYPVIPELVEAGKNNIIAQGKYWFLHPFMPDEDTPYFETDVIPHNWAVGDDMSYDDCVTAWENISDKLKKKLINDLKRYK